MLDGQESQKPLRADAGPGAEHALRMEGADPHGIGDVVERRLLEAVLGDVADRALDPVIVAIGGGGGCKHDTIPVACCPIT